MSRSLSFQAIFSLFQWTTGCQRQTIDALFRCGLSVSFDSVLNIISNLSEHCLALASEVAKGPHALCWDNINVSTSTFVEQRTDAPAKAQAGTFAVLYKLPRCQGTPQSRLRSWPRLPIATAATHHSSRSWALHRFLSPILSRAYWAVAGIIGSCGEGCCGKDRCGDGCGDGS